MASHRSCVTCGGPITSHGRDTKQCGSCWSAARVFCTDCGVELDKRNQRTRQCRACWLKAHPPRFCEGCGNRLRGGSRIGTGRCAACRVAEPLTCQDCGVALPRASRGTRCRGCHTKLRLTRVPTGCTVDGCAKPHRSKGLCITHYLLARRKAASPEGAGSKAKDWIGSQPCALCGYDKMRSDVHRVVPGTEGGAYVLGNMVPLCARCHAEVHRGLSPCPPVLLPPEHLAH